MFTSYTTFVADQVNMSYTIFCHQVAWGTSLLGGREGGVVTKYLSISDNSNEPLSSNLFKEEENCLFTICSSLIHTQPKLALHLSAQTALVNVFHCKV